MTDRHAGRSVPVCALQQRTRPFEHAASFSERAVRVLSPSFIRTIQLCERSLGGCRVRPLPRRLRGLLCLLHLGPRSGHLDKERTDTTWGSERWVWNVVASVGGRMESEGEGRPVSVESYTEARRKGMRLLFWAACSD